VMQSRADPLIDSANVATAIAIARSSSSPIARLFARMADASSAPVRRCENQWPDVGQKAPIPSIEASVSTTAVWTKGTKTNSDDQGDAVSASIHHWSEVPSDCGKVTWAPRLRPAWPSANSWAM